MATSFYASLVVGDSGNGRESLLILRGFFLAIELRYAKASQSSCKTRLLGDTRCNDLVQWGM